MLLRFPTQSFPGSTLIPLYSYALFSVFNCEVQTFQETVSFSPFSSDLFTNHKHKTHMFRTQEFFLCVVMVLWLSLRQPHSVNTSTVRSYCLKSNESLSSQTWTSCLIRFCISSDVRQIHLPRKTRRILYILSILSSLDECCAVSWPFVLSALFLIHTLSDCLHGFIFPSSNS